MKKEDACTWYVVRGTYSLKEVLTTNDLGIANGCLNGGNVPRCVFTYTAEKGTEVLLASKGTRLQAQKVKVVKVPTPLKPKTPLPRRGSRQSFVSQP